MEFRLAGSCGAGRRGESLPPVCLVALLASIVYSDFERLAQRYRYNRRGLYKLGCELVRQ
jgi:hypothetical protein